MSTTSPLPELKDVFNDNWNIEFIFVTLYTLTNYVKITNNLRVSTLSSFIF